MPDVIWDVLFVLLALLGLAAAVVLILVIFPVHVRFRGSTIGEDPAHLRVAAAVLGGLAPEIVLFDSDRGNVEDAKTAPEKPEKSPKPKSGKRQIPPVRQILPAAFRLLRDLLNVIHFVHLRADIVYGTGDPAETGEIYGKSMSFLYGARGVWPAEIALRPDFNRKVLEGEVDAALKLRPIALIPPAVRFGLALYRARKDE
ncbi:DUF2953 domain-containing protein [Chachezhania antarctica]|uniref:DUF2953 domain-containing protein n=1 Tax=Chachezhania antarctica TaxID=2340860 RepID=UPI000EB19061|nr:DUF2953 domain-containing protein [Chachezhania antarctica]